MGAGELVFTHPTTTVALDFGDSNINFGSSSSSNNAVTADQQQSQEGSSSQN
jgi:hypothetical protein